MNEERKEDREDLAWLEASEKGESELPPIDPARAETYQRMQLEISSLPELIAPDDGWEDAIYDELDRQDRLARNDDASRKSQRSIALLNATTAVEVEGESAKDGGEEKRRADDRIVPITRISDAKKPKRQWIAIGGAAAALAAVAVGAVWVSKREVRGGGPQLAGGGELPTSMPTEMALVVNTIDSDRIVRSESSKTISSGGSIEMEYVGDEGELRIYLQSRKVVARCSKAFASEATDTTVCTVEPIGNKFRLKLRHKTGPTGTYRTFFFKGGNVGEPKGNLNQDVEDCNCEPVEGLRITVQ